MLTLIILEVTLKFVCRFADCAPLLGREGSHGFVSGQSGIMSFILAYRD